MSNHMMNEHIVQARLEDARFILSHGGSMEEAARRTGVSLNTLEKNMERDAQRDSHEGPRAGQGAG